MTHETKTALAVTWLAPALAMIGQKRFDYHSAAPQYTGQRYWFGQFARNSPLFLVPGNHDGEFGWASTPDRTGMADWAYDMRLANFPMPVQTKADSPFYTVGPKQNYYAWNWGDAQFIVLDPFWPQVRRARGLMSGAGSVTLGKEQYDWLAKTLADSKARRTFVFIHHLVGGSGRESRGGAEASTLFEWGGQDAAGADLFATQRPGWAMPIHELLKKHHVTAVFHGHDHLYVRQERDGIAYIAVPQPTAGGNRQVDFAEHSYTSGTLLGGGYLRLKLTADGGTTLDYVSTIPVSHRGSASSATEVADSDNLTTR